MSNKIIFKYHPNVYDNDIIIKKNGVCQCCEKEVKEYCSSMYCEEDITCICLECVSNGKAAEKFKGEFVQSAELNKVEDKEKIEELFKRTPGYMSWQGEKWLACCNDFCAFIGDVGIKELENMKIKEEVIQDLLNRRIESFLKYREITQEEIKETENLLKENLEFLEAKGNNAGYLFKCLHCGKYYLEEDAE